jgi:serine/threonine protein kinase
MTIDDLTVAEHLGGSRKIDIYLCRSRKHDGLVACKILRARYAIDYSSLEAVMDEGHRLIGLNHPNVIEGYSVELLPYPRIVLEYLTGDTISNTFFRGNYGAFDVEDFVLVIEQLCDAVTYVHSQGMLHLDIKPANVMYDDGQVTLFDFSVAEEFSPDQTLRDNAGTTEYMAPEQALRRSLGYFTDVFGIGVVLYRLLAGGELPYGVIEGPLPGYDESRKQLDYSLPPPRPSSLNPQVSSALDDVVLKALSPEKSERHPDPETLKREILEAFWKEYDED